MTTIMEGSTKGDGALGGVDEGITEIIKEVNHEIPNIQASTPTLSNDEELRDVPLLKSFVNTLEESTNTSRFTPKSFSCKLLGVSSKVISCKRALIGNANYLMETMNKFVEGFINVERHKLEFGERMTTLLMESNEKLAIKQMEFELEESKA